jgi:uncharacterized protein (DUF1684 family)
MAFKPLYFTYVCGVLLALCNACKSNSSNPLEAEYVSSISQQRAEKDNYVLKNGIIEQANALAFKGLRYYEPDMRYKVTARIEWVKQEKAFLTADSSNSYLKIFLLKFRLPNAPCTLTAYTMEHEGKTLLFIPFRDKTNDVETYGGGRYLEFPYQGEKDSIILDFNLAFNPYCHYNHTYTCPAVPAENTLDIQVPAGEKKLYD